MVQTPIKPVTLTAFLTLPETDPACEFIDGKITQKQMPKGKHSRLQTKLSSWLIEALEAQGTGLAFSELRCTFGGASLVPDVVVLSSDRIPKDQNGDIADAIEVAPNATTRILSPQQSATKVIKNIKHCLNHGTEIGWLIDPTEKTILIFHPDLPLQILDQSESLLPMSQTLTQGELTVGVGTVFGWLQVAVSTSAHCR